VILKLSQESLQLHAIMKILEPMTVNFQKNMGRSTSSSACPCKYMCVRAFTHTGDLPKVKDKWLVLCVIQWILSSTETVYPDVAFEMLMPVNVTDRVSIISR
jgi:hypothetical protein